MPDNFSLKYNIYIPGGKKLVEVNYTNTPDNGWVGEYKIDGITNRIDTNMNAQIVYYDWAWGNNPYPTKGMYRDNIQLITN